MIRFFARGSFLRRSPMADVIQELPGKNDMVMDKEPAWFVQRDGSLQLLMRNRLTCLHPSCCHNGE